MVSDNPLALGVGKVRRREWRQSCADFPVHNRVDFNLRFSGESRIDGTIAGILVSNRQYVKAGDLLAEIDKRDLEAKLAAARTDLVQAKTMLPEIETQLSKAQAELERFRLESVKRSGFSPWKSCGMRWTQILSSRANAENPKHLGWT
jgi:multidrug efflux pump subunit AcrA (membrane-fusion protein)